MRRGEEGSVSTEAHRNDNEIEFDLSNANILVDTLQAANDGGFENEDIRYDSSGTNNAN